MLGKRFHFESPAVAGGEGAAELVIVRVVERVVSVAAVDHAGGEVAFAVWGVGGPFGRVALVVDREPEVVDAAFVVSAFVSDCDDFLPR